ncbi:MAG: FlgD immunoglobulin-like domain containing protein [Candidatus Eisenbacteria bacterium]
MPSEYTVVPGAGHGWEDAAEQVSMVEFFQHVFADVSEVSDGSTQPGAPEFGPDEPSDTTLDLNAYPNPLHGHTVLRLELLEPGIATIRIHDCAGRIIRTLRSERRMAGTHEVRWDGRDDSGIEVPAGVYYARASAHSRSGELRLVVAD